MRDLREILMEDFGDCERSRGSCHRGGYRSNPMGGMEEARSNQGKEVNIAGEAVLLVVSLSALHRYHQNVIGDRY